MSCIPLSFSILLAKFKYMVKALILTGGKSTRMGRDKYLLELYGKPQYQHLYGLIESLGIPVFLSCTDGQALKIPGTYQKVLDLYPSIGPIGGIASAVKADPFSHWLVVACDLGHLKVPLLQELLGQVKSEADVVTFKKSGSDYFETTISLYKPSSFPTIRSAIKTGEYSLQKVLRQCNVLALKAKDESQLSNLNYPEDLKGLKK